MDIFISWSGARSLAVAEALRDWLPMVINAAKPFLSVADIDKGARWSSEVAGRLEKSKAGIICLTPGNMNSHWLLFEAGALSKAVNMTYVCPLLVGLKPSDVKGPLAQFQFTSTSQPDMLQLFKTLNSALGEGSLPDAQIEKAFGLVWPNLEEQITKAPPEDGKALVQRSEREMLEEMLELVRNLGRSPMVDVPSRKTVEEMIGERELYLLLAGELDKRLRAGGSDLEALSVKYAKNGHYFVIAVTPRSGATLEMSFGANTDPDLMISILSMRLSEQPKWKPPVDETNYWGGGG